MVKHYKEYGGILWNCCGSVLLLLSAAVMAMGQSVTVSPTSTNYLSMTVGGTSTAKTFTLTNGQAVPLTISSVTISGDFFIGSNNCPLSPNTLASSKSCAVTVVFAPSAFGARSGTLSFVDDAGNSPQTAALSGTGTAPVSVTPSSLSFGNLGAGATSAPKTVTLKNNQAVALTINSIALTGAAYQLQSNTCPLSPATLGGGLSCTVTLIFLPTGAGTFTGALTFTHNAFGSPQSVSATGNGLAVSSITVTPASPSLAVGSTQQFTATAKYGNGSTQNITNAVNWTSSKTAIAIISNSAGSQGLASTLTAGTSTVTATYVGVAGSTVLTVSGPNLVSLAVTPANPSIALGTTQQFTATGTFSDGSTQDLTSTVSWSSSASGIASISNASGSQGLSTATGTGAATITASSGSISASTSVTVTPAALVSIAVTPAIPSIPLGTQQQFKATGTYTDNSTQDITTSVQWSSSASGIATVSNASGSQGLASTVTPGVSTITASSGSITGSTTLTVTAAALVSIMVSPANSSIASGSTTQFTAQGTFTDGSTKDLTSSVVWNSSNLSAATINLGGLATGVSNGVSTISATSGTIVGSTTLTVGGTLTSIAVNPGNPSIALGTTQAFIATGTFSDGSTQDLTTSVYWTSSAAGVGTVSDSAPTIGLATSTGIGTTTITATLGQITGSSTLTVTPASLLSISVAPQNVSIPLGTTQQFTATGTYTDGSSQNITGSVTWSSGSASVAVISNSAGTAGVATSAGQGTTTITATSGSVTNSTTLTVGAPQLVSLSVTPVNSTIAASTSQQFTATGTFSDGSTQNLTSSVTWSSSATAVATISSSGLSTGMAGGTTTITASSGSVNNSTSLTVTSGSAVLTSIMVTPVNPSVVLGGIQQFIATGNYSDGSTQVLTSQSAWTSSNTTVATIQSTGGATTLGLGTTSITASYSGISGSTVLSVISGPLFNAVPLMDMPQANGSCLTYKSFQGGLYENCSNSMPADHNADGLTFTGQVQPLDINGNPSTTGKIVFMSVGMSITAQEFGALITKSINSTAVDNARVALSNGAASNMDACLWFPAYGNPVCNPLTQNNYDRIAANLPTRGLNPLQVQVAWIKNANGRVHSTQRGCFPLGTLCVPLCDPTVSGCTNSPNTTDALNLEQELANTLRAAKQRWPNLRLAFFASRIYGGYAPASGGSPEPYAYETAFAVKWLIQAQINQMRGLGIDPVAGDLSYGSAPWIAWGPYMWADGPVPRSDGLVWCDGSMSPGPPCNGEVDFTSDGEHPLTVTKQVNMLTNFFLNSPFTQPWFAAH